MAQETVESIIRKAVADEAFRALLMNNPTEALSSYDLTDDERTGLSNLDKSIFDGSAGDLEDRLSRSSSWN
jgi:hypothetical protein